LKSGRFSPLSKNDLEHLVQANTGNQQKVYLFQRLYENGSVGAICEKL